MKVSIEGTPKEINELLQVIVSNQEQKVVDFFEEMQVGLNGALPVWINRDGSVKEYISI